WPTDLGALFHIQTADLQARAARPGGHMSTRRRHKEQPVRLPPLLVSLIHAAKHAPSDSGERAGHDTALADLARWALVRVPVEGILAPDVPDSFAAIQAVAIRHLRLGEARTAVRQALSVVESFEMRDSIESAYNQLQSVSDNAYYY